MQSLILTNGGDIISANTFAGFLNSFDVPVHLAGSCESNGFNEYYVERGCGKYLKTLS
jgi:hypothetical protein